MSTLSQELKKSYKVPIIIFLFVVVLTFGLKSRIGMFETSIIFELLIVILPLAVSISSFAVSRMYGNSRIFGRSYFLLGLGFFVVFVGELLYFIYYDIVNEEILYMFDIFFLAGYLFYISHMVINIRYFAEKINSFQKVLLVLVPISIVLGYFYLVYANSYDLDYYFYFNLFLVSGSSITLGLVIIGFTLFRRTVLISAWFLLLIGFLIGTIGDLEYHYYNTFGGDFLDNYSSILWLTSNLILVYALYRHQKSI